MRTRHVAIVYGDHDAVRKAVRKASSFKDISVSVISSSTPVRVVASAAGWDGEVDDGALRFLDDLGELMERYNDARYTYCCDMYRGFVASDDDFLIIHVRDLEEAARVMSYIGKRDRMAAMVIHVTGGKKRNQRVVPMFNLNTAYDMLMDPRSVEVPVKADGVDDAQATAENTSFMYDVDDASFGSILDYMKQVIDYERK